MEKRAKPNRGQIGLQKVESSEMRRKKEGKREDRRVQKREKE